MILGGNSLYDLSLDDFKKLIDNRVPEGPNLDYKQTAYAKSDEAVREMLRDVTSLSNTGGGYLVLGVSEDGFSRPVEFCPIEDIHAKSQSYRQACLDGIQERIDGLEVLGYEIDPNRGIIVIHVPVSEKTPHMVTRNQRSEFFRRYDTDKRVMTIGEIRDAFVASPFFRKLAEIQLQAQLASGEPQSSRYLQILTDRSVEKFLQRYMSCSDQQVLLIVSPFIGDLRGETYTIRDIINNSSLDKSNIPDFRSG